MSENTIISGTAMAVIVGTILIIAPWTISVGNLSNKIVISFLGLILVAAGIKFSRG